METNSDYRQQNFIIFKVTVIVKVDKVVKAIKTAVQFFQNNMRVPQGDTEENMVLGLFVVHGKLFTTIFLEREFILQQRFCNCCL